jgi:hypothetical protein
METAGIGQRRDFEGLKERRAQAARLFAKAKGRGALAGIARALEVSRQGVTRWAGPAPDGLDVAEAGTQGTVIDVNYSCRRHEGRGGVGLLAAGDGGAAPRPRGGAEG